MCMWWGRFKHEQAGSHTEIAVVFLKMSVQKKKIYTVLLYSAVSWSS